MYDYNTFLRFIMETYTEVNVKAMFKNLQSNLTRGGALILDEINKMSYTCKSSLMEIDNYCKYIVDTLIAVGGIQGINGTTYMYKSSKSVYTIEFDVEKVPAGSKKFVSVSAGETFGGKKFFNAVVAAVSVWMLEYGCYILAIPAMQMLNSNLDSFLMANKVCFSVQWDIGSDLVHIDDNCVIFGVKVPNVVNLLAVFRKIFTNQSSMYELADTLKMCVNPIDLLLVDNDITRKLGIYRRTSLSTRLCTVYTRPLSKVHTGVGFVKNSNFYAVVTVASLDAESAKYLPKNLYYITDNNKPTQGEEASNKTKLAYTFIIKPIGAYNIPYKISLQEIVAANM